MSTPITTEIKPPYKFLYLLPVFLVIISLACSIPALRTPISTPVSQALTPTPPPRPTPTQQALPPALVESIPPGGAEIPLDAPITLYFNQPMNKNSVESALKVRSFLIGDLTWPEESTLSINLGQELLPGTQLGIQISTGAQSSQGLSLSEPIILTFKTVGYLQVTQVLPEPGAREVDPSSAIVAAFSHPVVPLGAEDSELSPAFQLDPPATGRGEWINTSTYVFYPEPSLIGGKDYTVQINPGLHGLDGNPLDSNEPWSFSTALPRLESIQPEPSQGTIPLDSSFVISFNQPMDPANLATNFRLLDSAGGLTPGEFQWNKNFTELTYLPTGLLRRGSSYNLEVGSDAQANGGTSLGQEYAGFFRTVPELQVISSNPVQGGILENYSSVVLKLSSPLPDSIPDQLVSVEPRVPNLNYYWDAEQRELYIFGDFAPSTDYQLNLSPFLTDRWGGQLGVTTPGQPGIEYNLNFRSAPLPPELLVASGWDMHYLTSQDTSMAVQVRGLVSLPLSLGSVPLSDFLQMVDPNKSDFRWNYLPADQRTWQQTLDVNPDRAEQVDIAISPEGQSLPPGIYQMRADLGQDHTPSNLLIAISDIHLTIKIGATDALIWATDLRSNTPVANTPITLYDHNANIIASGYTDSQGVFLANYAPRADPYNPVTAIASSPGEQDFGISLSNWAQDVQAWSFNLPFDASGPNTKVYFYSDRPIYRPGQTVNFRLVARNAFNGRYQLPDRGSLPIQIFNETGQEIAALELPLSVFGTAHSEFTLPADARPGYYSMNSPGTENSYFSFQVADYRKPEINLKVHFTEEQAQAGAILEAEVDARYFFDAPAGNVPVSWTLTAQKDYFDILSYQVGLQGASAWDSNPFSPGNLSLLIAEGEATTGPDGHVFIDLPPPDELPRERQRYTLEVTATDESGLPVSGRANILINPAEVYIGIHPDSWSGRAGEGLGFDVLTTDWEKSALEAQSLRAEFQKVTWVRNPNTESDRFFGPQYLPQVITISSTDFITDAKGKARVQFIPPEPGTYQLSVFGSSASNQAAWSEILLWVGGAGEFSWPSRTEKSIEIVADQDSYQPGQTARVFIPNPFPDTVTALVSIERGKILRHQIVQFAPGGNTFELTLGAEDAPNVYISATLLGNDRQGLPDFRQGYINLPVKSLDQILNIQLTSQPERTGPGDPVTFEILVSDSNGQPVQGEFSLAVVDLAALTLAEPNSLAILDAFYGTQPLGIQTGIPLSIYAGRKASIEQATGMGGGGGDFHSVVRGDFPDTAFWQADIVTGADGKAQVNLPLPDSLTTWQVETRGVTQDTRLGQASTQVITTKPLLVRPVTPRFLVEGDHLQLAAIVQNNSPEILRVDVSLSAKGITLDEPATAVQTVSIPPNDRLRVNWWGTVQDQTEADLLFTAIAPDAPNAVLEDATRPTQGAIPILRYVMPQAFRTVGTLDKAGEQIELVSLPRGIDPIDLSGGNLQIDLAPSLAAVMLNALEALEESPFSSTEETLSRFLPNLEIYRSIQQFGLQSEILEARLVRSIDDGLKSLITRQNPDGGWSWWPGGESDPFITAYVLFGLTQAHDTGIQFNEFTTQRAIEYLAANLGTPSEGGLTTPELDRLVFGQYALTAAGAGNKGALESLSTQRSQLSPWAQAFLAISLQEMQPGNPLASTLLSDLGSEAIRSAAGAHWELEKPGMQNMMNTLTNSAIVVYALALRDPASPLITDAVRYLVDNRQVNGAWSSTYASAWTLMALSRVVRGTSELSGDFNYQVSLNNNPLAAGQASESGQLTPVTTSVQLSELYADSPNVLSIQRDSGPGRLYYSAILNVSRPAEQAPALKQGLSVERAYFPEAVDCNRQDCEPIQATEVGNKVQVRLTITLPNDAYYLVVQDFIPAGAEILDTRLLTSQQFEDYYQEEDAEEELDYDPRDPFAEGWGWWYFHGPEIYDDHIAWAADYLPAGTYELTYTLVPYQPGEFQVQPARAWQFYFAEVQAASRGDSFTIR